jgi:hypothetical protein
MFAAERISSDTGIVMVSIFSSIPGTTFFKELTQGLPAPPSTAVLFRADYIK